MSCVTQIIVPRKEGKVLNLDSSEQDDVSRNWRNPLHRPTSTLSSFVCRRIISVITSGYPECMEVVSRGVSFVTYENMHGLRPFKPLLIARLIVFGPRV